MLPVEAIKTYSNKKSVHCISNENLLKNSMVFSLSNIDYCDFKRDTKISAVDFKKRVKTDKFKRKFVNITGINEDKDIMITTKNEGNRIIIIITINTISRSPLGSKLSWYYSTPRYGGIKPHKQPRLFLRRNLQWRSNPVLPLRLSV